MSARFDPQELFCFYYLGLSPDGTYRFSNANHMARYYNTTVAEIMTALSAAELHPDTVVNTDFPMARYQVELQLASQEEDVGKLRAMASRIYEEFRAHGGKRRDWIAEIEAEQRSTRGD